MCLGYKDPLVPLAEMASLVLQGPRVLPVAQVEQALKDLQEHPVGMKWNNTEDRLGI